jgi:hypothetical protein
MAPGAKAQPQYADQVLQQADAAAKGLRALYDLMD